VNASWPSLPAPRIAKHSIHPQKPFLDRPHVILGRSRLLIASKAATEAQSGAISVYFGTYEVSFTIRTLSLETTQRIEPRLRATTPARSGAGDQRGYVDTHLLDLHGLCLLQLRAIGS
jgi:hypothetical protein